jgi:hypothetical protein
MNLLDYLVNISRMLRVISMISQTISREKV